jgi:MFS transporter, DHA2 family, multidrug resistance protein
VSAVSAVPGAASVPTRAGRREWIGLSVLALACLLYVMDLTVLHLAVPALSEDLQPSSAQLLWIIDIYGFMVAGFLVTMGTLGDRIGRRKLLLIGAAAFGVVSLFAAFSRTPEQLIASRALLGIAGATLAPSTLSLIFSMFQDPGQRARAIAVWISAFSAGSAIGPVLGGIMLEHFWWGSVFLLALPVMVALVILGPLVLPEYKDPDAGRLDLPSAAMSLVAVLAVIFGLKELAQDGISPLPIGSILLGIAVGVAFVRRQLRLDDPIIDLRLFRIPSFSVSLAVNFLTIFVAVGYFLFVAQYLQLVLGLTPLAAGLCSVPSAIGFIVGSNLAPRIVRQVRPAHVMAGGLLIAATGLALLTRVTGPDGLAVVIIGSVVISLGLAPVLSLTTELIVGSAPPERAGAASGISETGVELGGALGIAVLGSLGVAIYRREVLAALPPDVPLSVLDAARDTLGGAVAASVDLPPHLGTLVTAAARNAFVDGMAVAAGISAIIAVGIAVLAFTLLRDVRPAAMADSTGVEVASSRADQTTDQLDRHDQPDRREQHERHARQPDGRRACPAPDA